MTLRFRLDSVDGPEALHLGCLAGKITRRGERAERLLLHWWRLGLRRETALRCPTCGGDGMSKAWDNVACGACHGKGWSMPGERP